MTVFMVGMFCTGCSFSSFLQGNVFEDVWNEKAQEYVWSTSEKMKQETTRSNFIAWAAEFEKKRDAFVRKDEDGNLQGSTVILGRNLEQKRQEYQASLEKLETIIELQKNIKNQTAKICEYQKSSVKCDL
jgi:hypothetical protein